MTPERNAEPALTARSALASTLLGEDPPELPVAHLVRVAGLLGIQESSARAALSRMVRQGEATSDGAGRYRLVGELARRGRRQQASRQGEVRPWDGGWTMVVVTTGRPAGQRAEHRRRLAQARLAEQREGVWLRPDNLVLPDELARDPELAIFSARPLGPRDAVALAAALWDLAGWERRARDLIAQLQRQPPHEVEDLAPGFVLSAAVLRHLQADPLLPAELLPPAWPGADLRRTYDAWDGEYRRLLRAWGRRQS